LFNGGILNSQLKVAEIQRQQTLIQEKIAIIEAQAEFLLVNSERAMLKDLLLLEKENFELAQKNLSFALERYKLGSANELTVKEAQRSYEQASNRFQKLKFEAKVAELRLKRVKGDLLPAKGI
jgi:outer membrane protein TolC